MAIYNLYSKRQKQLRGEMPDVYVYDTFPQALRVQLVQIIEDGIGKDSLSNEIYSGIHRILCREYGIFSLVDQYQLRMEDQYQLRTSSQPDWEAIKFTLLNTEDADQIVDIVELCLSAVDHIYARGSIKRLGIDPVQMIDEVNSRFREHGVGYSYSVTAGKIIRVDSQLLHQEVVRPVLQLLADAKYSGANQEFLKAHEHYRHKRYKECLNECLKAFESTMKVICDTKHWAYGKGDTAKALINSCLSNGLIPSFQQNQLSHLTAILESVPTVRNKLSGHGQGSSIQNVPEEMASFMLHITASNILLFIESEKRLSLSNNP